MLLTREQVAARLAVSPSMVSKLHLRGVLPAVRYPRCAWGGLYDFGRKTLTNS